MIDEKTFEEYLINVQGEFQQSGASGPHHPDLHEYGGSDKCHSCDSNLPSPRDEFSSNSTDARNERKNLQVIHQPETVSGEMFDWLKNKKHIYMNRSPGGDIFNYRGMATGNDDPESFTRLMKKHGLKVMVLKNYRGKRIDSELNIVEL